MLSYVLYSIINVYANSKIRLLNVLKYVVAIKTHILNAVSYRLSMVVILQQNEG